MKDRNTSKHLCLCFGLLPMLNIYQFIFYNFLRLRFQRVHQAHPAHGVTGFHSSSVTPAASIMRGSMASMRSRAARSISNRCGYSISLKIRLL